MTLDQRDRMIRRFNVRRDAAQPGTVEWAVCTAVLLGLCYMGSVRTINRIVGGIRREFRHA